MKNTINTNANNFGKLANNCFQFADEISKEYINLSRNHEFSGFDNLFSSVNGKLQQLAALGDKISLLVQIGTALSKCGGSNLTEISKNCGKTGKSYKKFKAELLAIEPLLSSRNCNSLKEIKNELGYDVEFRATNDGEVFVTYMPELRRTHMESNSFVLSRVSMVYDTLKQVLQVH